jgi:hypothetical protein
MNGRNNFLIRRNFLILLIKELKRERIREIKRKSGGKRRRGGERRRDREERR